MAQGGNKPPIIPPDILAAVSRGWRVFPVHSAPGGICSCANPECSRPGKHPRTRHGHLDATTDIRTILAWLRRWLGCNWAVATGEVSGIWVLDVDGAEGRLSLAELEAQHGPLSVTLISRTGRDEGGEHLWFALHPDADIRNSTGYIGQGLDVRGNGGYTIIPPSVHETGRAYQWLDSDTSVVNAPGWLVAAALEANPQSNPPDLNLATGADNPIPEGQRNTRLTSEAGRLRRRGWDRSRTWTRLQEINADRCEPSLPEEDVAVIAASISRPEYAPLARLDPSQSLHDFVRDAISKNKLAYTSSSRIRTPLFVFARMMKGRPEIGAKRGMEAAQLLDGVFAEIFEVSPPWEAAFGEISSDPRADFIQTWGQVNSPVDALSSAWAAAQAFPLKPLLEYSSKYTAFLSLAAHLQRKHPDRATPLPTKRLGEILDCDRTMVGHYRDWAQGAGLLSHVKAYKPREYAAEYRFQLDKFDWETGEELRPSSEPTPSLQQTAQAPESGRPPVTSHPFPPSHGEAGVPGKPVVPGEPGVPDASDEPGVTAALGVAVSTKQANEDDLKHLFPRTDMADRSGKPGLGLNQVAVANGPVGPMTTLPQCPNCRSAALYRDDNSDTYECMTCDLKGIPVDVAGRTA